jgi:hypothetical protein
MVRFALLNDPIRNLLQVMLGRAGQGQYPDQLVKIDDLVRAARPRLPGSQKVCGFLQRPMTEIRTEGPLNKEHILSAIC